MRLSILMPTYNRASVIANALRSAAVQAGKHELEMVLVDDSTDDTLEVAARAVAEFPACRLVADKPPARLGLSRARSRSIDLATGEVLIFLDSDDELAPGAIEYVASFFEKRSDTDILFGAIALKSGRRPRRKEDFLDRFVTYRELVSTDGVGEFLPIVRRTVFEESGVRFPADIEGFEGCVWYELARRGYRFFFTSKVVRIYGDVAADRIGGPSLRLTRARQLCRGHIHAIRTFGGDVRRFNRLRYHKMVAKALVYNRVAQQADSACDSFLAESSPLLFQTIALVPKPIARALFGAAARVGLGMSA